MPASIVTLVECVTRNRWTFPRRMRLLPSAPAAVPPPATTATASTTSLVNVRRMSPTSGGAQPEAPAGRILPTRDVVGGSRHFERLVQAVDLDRERALRWVQGLRAADRAGRCSCAMPGFVVVGQGPGAGPSPGHQETK